MGTVCCHHTPSLKRKASLGYVYHCSKCDLESPPADTEERARNLWVMISKGCIPLDATVLQWRDRKKAS